MREHQSGGKLLDLKHIKGNRKRYNQVLYRGTESSEKGNTIEMTAWIGHVQISQSIGQLQSRDKCVLCFVVYYCVSILVLQSS